MRGSDGIQEALFTFSRLEDFVPTEHPLRSAKALPKAFFTEVMTLAEKAGR